MFLWKRPGAYSLGGGHHHHPIVLSPAGVPEPRCELLWGPRKQTRRLARDSSSMALQLPLASSFPHRDEAAPVLGLHVPLAVHSSPRCYTNHMSKQNPGPWLLISSAHTCFPFTTQPDITSSRKLALTIPSPSSNPLHCHDHIISSSAVYMSVSQAHLEVGVTLPSSESTAQCLAYNRGPLKVCETQSV